MGSTDAQTLFRAARAQREFKTTKLSKEQLRSLRERRAPATAGAQAVSTPDERTQLATPQQAELQHDAAATASPVAIASLPEGVLHPLPPRKVGNMGPPASRAKPSVSHSVTGVPADDTTRSVSSIAGSGGATDQSPAQAHDPPQAPHAAQLPAGFFEDYADELEGEAQHSVIAEPQTQPLIQPSASILPQTEDGMLPAPAAQPRHSSSAAASPQGPQGPLPKGFFENKDADAKARGEAPAKKKTAAEEYDDFMTSVAADVRDIEVREQTEAAEAAEERQDREEFEQWVRLDRIEEFRKEREQAKQLANSTGDGSAHAPIAPTSKRKRPFDVLDSSSEESEDDAEEDNLLDWRAKGA